MENYQHTIRENSLEWITNYPNINCPRFTPIIPLVGNDYMLFVNPGDGRNVSNLLIGSKTNLCYPM